MGKASWRTTVHEVFNRRSRRPSRRQRDSRVTDRQPERLEERRVMAFDLVSAYAASTTPFFVSGQNAPTLNEAPQELTLRFSPGVTIDASTLDNISIIRSGGAGDGFGAAGSKSDVPFVRNVDMQLSVDDLPDQNQVVIRFPSVLPDDSYRIVIGGGLKTVAQGSAPADSFRNGATYNLDFRLDVGAFVMSVVPQPITRTAGGLSQDRNAIAVYFNREDPLNQASAAAVTSYQLFEVDASTGNDSAVAPVNPTAVTYDPTTGKAVLTFAAIVENKLYRLQVGDASAAVAAPAAKQEGADFFENNSSFATAADLGALTSGGATVNAAIDGANRVVSTPAGSLQYPGQPGSVDEPGHRRIPVQFTQHGASSVFTSDGTNIPVVQYNFQDVYGVDPSGNILHNAITPEQKQRAREIFEIFSRYTGIRFEETESSGMTIATGDVRANGSTIPPTGVAGISGASAIMNSSLDWGASEYGGAWFQVAMHEIGHNLGLAHSYDLPSIMGGGLTGEAVFPGDYDTEQLIQIFPTNGSDVDLYTFTLDKPGTLTAETIVARPGQIATSTLDSVITLYREDIVNGKTVRTMVARNDDYYGRDSFVGLDVTAGKYFVAVSSTGNTNFDPDVSDSGYGGRSDGGYELKLAFIPKSTSSTTIVDASGTAFDGDRDGKPGGAFNFWFTTASAANTVYVDKAAAAGGDGSLATPYNTIQSAIANIGSKTIIRIVGNTSNLPYLIGTSLQGATLPDGKTFNVPKGVTVMIDEGAILKFRAAILDVGTSSTSISSRASAALQVLGTPTANVLFTSYHDDSIGGNSDGVGPAVAGGQWGGIVMRADSDSATKKVFLNSISEATISYGGGQVLVDSQLESFAPIQLETTRPTVAFNTITNSAGPGIAADPNSFEESTGRVGPEIHGNRLVNNSINGLFVNIRTNLGSVVDKLNVPARFKSTDIVYVLQENLLVDGGVGGYIDAISRTGSTSAASFQVTNLARTSDLRVGMPVSGNGIPGGTTIASIDSPTSITLSAQPAFTAVGVALSFFDPNGVGFARQSGSLTVDPGVVVKLQGARIELDRGIARFTAEGTAGKPVIFTSLGDNRFGAGGTFSTHANLPDARAAGDWGGIVVNAGARASIDNAYIGYGGGQTPIEGGFDQFNVIEVHQGDLRVAHSRIENNAAGTSTSNRDGRGTNVAATIFARGAQPVILGNDFRDNLGAIVSINANSLTEVSRPDPGRSTGDIDRDSRYDDNLGPLVRDNRISYTIDAAAGRPAGAALGGMEVRGEEITVESVWDDVDMVHVLRNEIIVHNFHTATGVRLLSAPDASLIVKLAGANAGFTAAGYGLDIADRIGGTVQVVGQPGYPVIFSSLKDDSIGASLDPLGLPTKDTNSDGSASTPSAGDWRSLKFLPLSNDRNVAIIQESEKSRTGGIDQNSTPADAQVLGVLAPNYPTGTNSSESAQEKSGDDNRRLGFEVHGNVAFDSSSDVDVYSFVGYAGSEVWIDIDKTSPSLDTMLELLDANGNVLARSADAQTDASLAGATVGAALAMQKDSWRGGDFYTTNPRDAAMRVVLPLAGQPAGTQAQYYVRVRSQPHYDATTTQTQYEADLADPAKVAAGVTSGGYELRIRLRQQDEKPGSTVRYADIRYPTIGIDVQGLPHNSPLVGENGENATDANNGFGTAQYVGNLLESDRNTISIAGNIASSTDVDWFTFALNYEQIQVIGGLSNGLKSWATMIDLDYGDGFRGDLSLWVFDSTGKLIFAGRDSNVASDQPGAGQGTDADDLSRGSFGKLDPMIGSAQLPAGNPTGTFGGESGGVATPPDPTRQLRYYVAVSSNEQLPSQLNGTFKNAASNTLVRLEPISSVNRVVEDHIGFTGYTTGTKAINATVAPTTAGPLINTLNLATHVTPFTLSDVTLFVSTGDSLQTVDAMRGGIETTIATGFGGGTTSDLVMRSDGRLYSYRGLNGTANTAGQVSLVDTGTGALTTFGNDSIPDAPTSTSNTETNLKPGGGGAGSTSTFSLAKTGITAVTSGTIQYTDAVLGTGTWNFSAGGSGSITTFTPVGGVPVGLQTPLSGNVNGSAGTISVVWSSPVVLSNVTVASVTYNFTGSPSSLTSDAVDAIAWGRTDVAKYDDLYYSVNTGGASRLFRADPSNGSAAPVTGKTWGAVGNIQDLGNNLGVVTGMQFMNGKLYGVDTKGYLFTINTGTGLATLIDFDPSTPAVAEPLKVDVFGDQSATGTAVRFGGLALGPQNLYDGALKHSLFAIDSFGRLRAFSVTEGIPSTATLLQVFDSDNDGVADATRIATNVFGATGLAFSPLDVNLWHPTTRRATDAGHGINAAPDNTRDSANLNQTVIDGQGNARENAESEGGVSMYFGLEQYVSSLSPYLNYQSSDGQYGVLNGTSWQQDLSSNAAIRNSYNLPGGAYGSLTTNSFSLTGYTNTDKPTLYFNYWLQTEPTTAGTATGGMVDSARAFISSDGGVTWTVLATNDTTRSAVDKSDAELPTFSSVSSNLSTNSNQDVQQLFNSASWRQARIDLGKYAGQSDLRLRFDFSTAGEMDSTQIEAVNTTVAADAAAVTDVVVAKADRILPGMTVVATGVVGVTVVSVDTATQTVTLSGAVTLLTGDAIGFTTLQSLNGIKGPARTVGDFTGVAASNRGKNNGYEGFYVDDIIVGFAERGEMVTGAASGQTDFFAAGTASPSQTVPVQSLQGNYQLEIRRGTEYAGQIDPIKSDYGISQTFDTNTDLVAGNGGLGDANSPRQQGQFLIEGNSVSNALTYGISIDAGLRDAGTNAPNQGVTASLPVLNSARLVPGVVVTNNIIASSGTAGILFSGDPNTGNVPLAAVPYGRLVNNTIYGGADVSLTSATTKTSTAVTVSSTSALRAGMLVSGTGIAANTVIQSVVDATRITLSAAATATSGSVGLRFRDASTKGTGVAVTENAGPTLLNNLFANLATGVSVDAGSAASTVIGTSAYWNTSSQVTGGSQSQQVTLSADPFVNAPGGNFYLNAGSQAIDSSLNTLADRSAYVAVTSAIGIPQSPIIAPDRDRFGQLRSDDPTQASLPGLGSNAFKDRGAVDRVDTTQPSLVLLNPLDNGPDDKDTLNSDAVRLELAAARSVTQFELQLDDIGVGIDTSTVSKAAFTLSRNGVVLVEGTDYLFRYFENNNRVVFESAAVFPMGDYVLTATTRASVPGVAGLLTDLANNKLLPNKVDGSTSFTISLADVPSVPANLVATAGDTTASVSWDAAVPNNSPIVRYEVEYRTFAGVSWTSIDAGLATSLTVNGLTNGTAYVFRVRAVNGVGNGDWSAESAPAMPLPVPTMALTSDTGSSASDSITNNASVTVAGLFAGSTWESSIDSGTTWTAGVGTTFTLPAGSYAAGTVRVRQLLNGFSSSAVSNGVAWVVDQTAPAAPVLALGTGVANGASAAEATQNTGVVTVSGEANASIAVTFTRGANSVTKTVTATGSAQAVVLLAADLVTLGDGTINVSAVATDVAGNVGPAGTTSFTLDTVPPVAPVLALGTGVADGATAAEATQPSGVVTVSGETNASIAVTFTRGANSVTKTLTGTGSAQAVVLLPADLLTLGVGTVNVSAVATDVVGNVGPAGTTSFTLDTVPPPAPVLALGTGVTGGATQAEATQPSGVVTVSGEANASIAVTFTRGANSVTKTLTGTGSAQAVVLLGGDLVTLGNGTVNVSAVATDVAGNVGPAGTTSFTLDTVAPVAPVLALGTGVANGATAAEATQPSGVVTVSGEANASIAVTFTRGANSVTKTVTATGSAQAVVLLPADLVTLGNGTINVSAVATDVAGNVGPAGTTSFTLDTVPPPAPVLALGTGVTGGATQAEATQPSGVVTVSGEANASIAVTFTRGANSVTKTVTGTGSAQAVVLLPADLVTLGNGTVTVSAVATDVAGNVGPAGTTSFTLDTVAPVAPVLALGTGIANGATAAEATQPSGVVTVSGEATASIAVTFTRGANSVTKTVTATGSAQAVVLLPADLVTLGSGTVTVSAVATDVAGNVGPAGTTSFTLDTVPPPAPVLALGTGVTGGATQAEATQPSGVVTVSGEANASIAVTFTRGANSVTKTLTGTGSAQAVVLLPADLVTLGNGTVTVSAVATDVAGNVGPAGTTSFTLDTVAPVAPVLALGTGIANGATAAEATQPSGVVTVSGEATASIAVTFTRGANSVTKTVTATGSAQAVVLLPADLVTLGSGTVTVSAVATDVAGNVGPAGTTSFTLDTVPPPAPVLALGTGVTGGATQAEATQPSGVVTVSGEANASIAVTFTRGVNSVTKTLAGTGSAQAVVLLPADLVTLGNGTINVSAVQTDVAGNVGPAGTTSFTLDTVAPTLSSFTSTATDGTYGTGASIPLLATLSKQVRFGGALAVTLNTGAVAVLTASAQGNVLTGSYVVSPGETTSDLDVVSYTIVSPITDLAGNVMTSNALPPVPGQLAVLKQIAIDASVSVSATGFSTDATQIPDKRVAVRAIPITFTTPVRGVSLSALRLFYNGRSVSLAGARITGSGANYTLTLPVRATNLKGIYSLRILPTAGIVATANGAAMTQTPQIYWGYGRSVGMAPTPRALAFSRP